ncbi:MAG: hypothetical protein IJR90_00070 [Clostridia bacterium]|nr:hypothetical protein [Clostridia bacterium]
MIDKKIYTVVDIGSNTVKCAVFLRRKDKAYEIASDTEKLGLIAGIRDGRLTEERTDALCRTVERFRLLGLAKANENGIGAENASIHCFATAALRGVDNFDEINAKVAERVGASVVLLSAEEEARTAFAGFRTLNAEPEKGILADMGGGSTELTEFSGNEIIRLTSMAFGCLSLYKRFCAGEFPTPEEEEKIYAYAADRTADGGFAGSGGTLCAVGGTGNAIRRLLGKYGIGGDNTLTPDHLDALRARLSSHDPEDIALIEKLIPTRRETIIPGLCAYSAIARAIGADKIMLLKGGLREGIMKGILDKYE